MRTRFRVPAIVGVAVFVLASLFVAPGSAYADTTLPAIGATELIASVRAAKPGPLAGTLLFELPGMPGDLGGQYTARLWLDGAGRRRVSLPDGHRERTVVDDGANVWSWDSATRSVTKAPASEHRLDEPADDPIASVCTVLSILEHTSTARMDPVTTVANRPAYQVVLTPLPQERTVLREIRVAVDGQTRLPLQIAVLPNGASEPALRFGFQALQLGAQDPALFRFTPAPGVSVRGRARQPPVLVGQGWDTVLVQRLQPDAAGLDTRPGTPTRGRWGDVRLVKTSVGNAMYTKDNLMAVGPVPPQVLAEALGR
ncbi:MAG: outer membrane lipoprotein carrier protein LolA [Pseudonocardia sp.]|nr:outer membrane lipoprotein carrier protein LolA [Pseudonocardia sp.]